MNIRHIIISTVLLGLLSACSIPKTDLTSPCVGDAGSPCGPRVPVNDWWIKSDRG
jgi:hypothetical protein